MTWLAELVTVSALDDFDETESLQFLRDDLDGDGLDVRSGRDREIDQVS